jgi:hypothetical protein
MAETKEGKAIEFNLEEIKEHSIEFFKQSGLKELTQELENVEIQLTDEQISQIQEIIKENGFDSCFLFPSAESQAKYLKSISEQTTEPLKGLDKDKQYIEKNGMFWGPSDSDFPNHIQTNNRPKNKQYFSFFKDTQEPDKKTLNKTAAQLREIFKSKNLASYTLSEYLIFQRDYVQKHKDHPETKYWTWLLDSELDAKSSEPGRVLDATWNPDDRQVKVLSHSADFSTSSLGARSSAIFEIL